MRGGRSSARSLKQSAIPARHDALSHLAASGIRSDGIGNCDAPFEATTPLEESNMKTTTWMAATLLALCSHAGTALADSAATDPHGGRPPSAGDGTAPEGGTGSKAMKEGTQIGAPGNVVTAAEGSVMTGHDVDADGFISKDEAARNGDLKQQFAKLDANRDGKLDETEFKAFTPSKSAVTGATPSTTQDAAGKKAK